jgi:hypothetical protein
MQESGFPARKHSREVAVKVAEYLIEIECARISSVRRDHVIQSRPDGSRPISQNGRGDTPDRDCQRKIRGGKMPLFPAQPVLITYEADE